MTEQQYQDARDHWSGMNAEQKFEFMVEVSRDYAGQYGLPPDTFHYYSYGQDDPDYAKYGVDYGFYRRSDDSIHFNVDRWAVEDFNESVNTSVHETLHGIDDITGYSDELDSIQGVPNDDSEHDYIREESTRATQDYSDYNDNIWTVIGTTDGADQGDGGRSDDGGYPPGEGDGKGDGSGRDGGAQGDGSYGDFAAEAYEQANTDADQSQDGGYSLVVDPNIDIDMSADPEIYDTNDKVIYVDFSESEAGTVN